MQMSCTSLTLLSVWPQQHQALSPDSQSCTPVTFHLQDLRPSCRGRMLLLPPLLLCPKHRHTVPSLAVQDVCMHSPEQHGLFCFAHNNAISALFFLFFFLVLFLSIFLSLQGTFLS